MLLFKNHDLFTELLQLLGLAIVRGQLAPNISPGRPYELGERHLCKLVRVLEDKVCEFYLQFNAPSQGTLGFKLP